MSLTGSEEMFALQILSFWGGECLKWVLGHLSKIKSDFKLPWLWR